VSDVHVAKLDKDTTASISTKFLPTYTA